MVAVVTIVLAMGLVSAQAGTFEAAASNADALFMGLAAAPSPRFARPAVSPSQAQQPGSGAGTHVEQPRLTAAATPPAGGQDIKLSALLNRHLKTNLAYTLGGKSVWISGAFDRSQKAYVSVLEEGTAARFYNVEEVLTQPATIAIGNASYKLSLSPDLSDQLESEIVLTNAANRRDKQRITLREMLGAVAAAGEEVKVGGQSYRLFYYNDVKNGQADPDRRTFAFILTDAQGEFHVFLVPAELVPANKVAVFKLRDNRAVGLQVVGDSLRIFDNP